MGRIACAYVPRFELALRARADPGLWSRPVAAVDWAARPPRLLCVTPAAEKLGARVGEIASRMRARLPELSCLAPDAALREQGEREILTALSTLSPRLDSDGRGAFFLGLEGLERLIPSDGQFLERLAALFAGLGLRVRLAIAESPFVAWVAAQHAGAASQIVAEQDEQALLDALPLAELALSEPARELCALLGLRSAGALRKLPAGALAERLGPEGVRLEKLCRGESFAVWPASDKAPRAPESVELDFDFEAFALEGLEPLLLAFRSLLDRLLSAVAAERRALVELGVAVRLDDRSEVHERFVPEAPTLSASALLELLKLWLERRPFRDRVVGLRLTASRVGPASQSQLSLLRQHEEQAEAAFGRAVARLSAAFGSGAVLSPRLADTYRPEGRLVWGAALEQKAAKAIAVSPLGELGPPFTLALRQLDPPERVGLRDGTFLAKRGSRPARIVQSDGPQRLVGEWWANGFRRSYHWLLLEGGELAWIFRDDAATVGDFFLQAWAD